MASAASTSLSQTLPVSPLPARKGHPTHPSQHKPNSPFSAHIHEAPKGETGPPRIAFPNPVKTGDKDERISVGCLKGPFVTGVESEDTGMDTGAGFHVSQIEEDPAAFFCDVHSSLAVPGAVRGQLG